ncbi:MAG: hypothetical protein F6K42_18875 [Leptolyngbya sp. SIO1D8]|nr:hypothetical protein [Leptolyngbya sp. SIO1D8]
MIWEIDGLERLSRLMRYTYENYYRSRNDMARLCRLDRTTLPTLDNAWKTERNVKEETIRSVAPFIKIPDLDGPYWLEEGEKVAPSACFTGSEFVAVARGIIVPRVTQDEPRPALSAAILRQAERVEQSIEDIAKECDLPPERIERMIALGGWGIGTRQDYRQSLIELVEIGGWYGDISELAEIYGIVLEEPENQSQQEKNGAKA